MAARAGAGLGQIEEALRERLRAATPTAWLNARAGSQLEGLELGPGDLRAAEARWARLAPLLRELFPAEAPTGRIASELQPLPAQLAAAFRLGPAARGFVKADSHLPVCASVKARGGLYEVFCRAEQVCVDRGLLEEGGDLRQMASAAARGVLAEEEVAVGSTGNLGLSVGLAGASLGMRATVHMSSDAKAWKKALLRSRGVSVVEHTGLYEKAVAEGRRLAASNPHCHFVDDESSTTLFLGYSAAARELQAQLQEQNIAVSEGEPLVVYIPCGVGGAPGGICWGLKHVFGDAVHVFFAEPTHAPCVTVGLASGLHDQVSVHDIGLDGRTEADGLAVGRASGFVCRMVEGLVSGTFTVDDEELFASLARLLGAGSPFMEPSCCAAFLGPRRLRGLGNDRIDALLERGTHVFWATGGALVPQAEQEAYQQRGQACLDRSAPGEASRL